MKKSDSEPGNRKVTYNTLVYLITEGTGPKVKEGPKCVIRLGERLVAIAIAAWAKFDEEGLPKPFKYCASISTITHGLANRKRVFLSKANVMGEYPK